METNLKEKLIEIVRKYECLYNPKHKQYRNKTFKLLIWERIGTTLDIEGNKAKEIWRTLRDGYVRHKKQLAGKSGSARKYNKYTWASQMDFLDGTLELRPTSILTPKESTSPCSSPIASFTQVLLPMHPGPPNAETPPPPPHIQLPLSNLYTQINNHSSITKHSAERSPVQKQNNSTYHSSDERTDKILEYIQKKNRKRHEYDDVDHLFASYAKTFKRLSRRTQAEIKINLAKLFAEAEITELDRDTKMNESPISEVVYMSPEYSLASDDSSQPVY